MVNKSTIGLQGEKHYLCSRILKYIGILLHSFYNKM